MTKKESDALKKHKALEQEALKRKIVDQAFRSSNWTFKGEDHERLALI